MNAPLAIGVIGCGRMGTRRAGTVAAHPAATLTAVADVDPALAQALADELGAHAASVDELLADPDTDTVVVSTPNYLHAEIALAAMRRGKHVICEKPMARTPVEAAAMVAAAREHDVTLKVGANLREFANVQAGRNLMAEGAIGEPLSLRGWIGNEGWAAQGWFGDPALSGGGTVLDNGCHLFDLSRWLLGEMQTCSGITSRRYWDIAVEDYGVGVFTSAQGVPVTIECSWTEWAPYFGLELCGTRGRLLIDNRLPSEQTILLPRGGTAQVFDFGGQRLDTYAAELANYVIARAAGVDPSPTGQDGLRVVEMAHAVYRAAREGRSVLVHEEP